jgi:hypothetical protein
VRGGITKGNIAHRDRILFGTAYMRAYDLEKGVANYPRIVFSPEVVSEYDNQFPLRFPNAKRDGR